MEDQNYQYYDVKNPFEPKKRRPTLITVLCILTFIGSGLNLISYSMWALMGKMMASMQIPFQMEQFQEMMAKMAEVPSWKYWILVLLFLGSIFGAVLMLFMKKLGFHIYLGVQILLMFLPSFFIYNHFIPDLISLITTGIFVFLYGINYKYMSWNLNEEKEPESDENEQ